MKEYNAEYHYEPYWNYGAFAHTPCQAEIVFDIDDAGTSKENKGKCEECGETITIERDEWDRIQAEFGAETFDTEGKICSGCQIYGYWDDRQPCPMCRGEYDAEDEWSEGRHGTTTYYTTYIPTPELPDIKCKECGDSMYVDSLDYNGDDCEIIYACSCKYVAPTCNECGVSINSWACGSGEGLCPMHSTCQKPVCVERRANLGIASDGKAYPKRDLSNMSIYGRGNAPNKDAECFSAESPSATIPSWATPLATVIGFGLGFLGIRELKRRA